MTKKPKKIILFITDQQRYDTFSALGHPVIKTPNFDKLIEEGVYFSRAYSHYPLCVPARTNMWTGLPAHVTGVTGNGIKPPLGTVFLPEIFSDLDWYTVNVGRLHFLPARNPHGFQRSFLSEGKPFENDYYLSKQNDPDSITADSAYKEKHIGVFTDEYLMPITEGRKKDGEDVTSWVTDTAIDQIIKSGSKPMFMNVGYIRPHPTFEAPEGWNKMYDPKTIPLPQNRFQREGLPRAIRKLQDRKHETMTVHDYVRDDILNKNMAMYYGDISHIDYNLGKLVTALKENGMWEDTLLICTSDHGEMLGNHGLYLKLNFYEESARIPLIISWPNGLPKGKKIDEVVSLQDIFTTCVELIGHPISGRYLAYRGRNLVDMANGEIPENNRVFVESMRGYAFCNVSKKYKYSFYMYQDGTWEDILFDLEQDPCENNNVATLYPEKVKQFRKEIVEYLEPDVSPSHYLHNTLKILKGLI